jgi:hypothetical protein
VLGEWVENSGALGSSLLEQSLVISSEITKYELQTNSKFKITHYKKRGTLEVTYAIIHPCIHAIFPNTPLPQHPITPGLNKQNG